MNHTTEDSREFAELVGGDTIPLEDGTIEMPPEQAKNTAKIVEDIEQGDYMIISVGYCKAEDLLSKMQIEKLKANRAARVTEKAKARNDSQR